MSRDVHLELILGRPVLGRDDKSVGRIEEVRAERQGSQAFVTEYLIGVRGLLERLAVESVWRHEGRLEKGYVARWNQVDITDPSRPRLLCEVSELERAPREKSR